MPVSVDLRLGDCLEVMKSIPDGSVDAVVTDPPYFQPAAHYVPARGDKPRKKLIGDMSVLEAFFGLFIAEAMRIVSPDGFAYIFCDGQSYPIAFTGLYPHVKNVRPLVWDKAVSFNGYTWRHQHELIAFGERDLSPRIPTGDGDILRFRAVKVDARAHPAEKPIDLLVALVSKTKEGGTVLDPFMGSGTTGVACVQTGRNFIGIEIDPGYFAVAKKRIAEAQLQMRLPIDG